MTHTAKHTPGPLKAVQIIIENSPCTWAVQRKNIREQWGKPSVATYIDNEADARLFAAAPAMYEALQGCLRVAQAHLHDTLARWEDCEGKVPSGIAELDAARMEVVRIQAVLSQAEGQQL